MRSCPNRLLPEKENTKKTNRFPKKRAGMTVASISVDAMTKPILLNGAPPIRLQKGEADIWQKMPVRHNNEMH